MYAHADWGQSRHVLPNTNAPPPNFHFSHHSTHLHAIYINACPHAKLLAKEPQPGHAVKEAVIELGRKRFGIHLQGLSVDGESPHTRTIAKDLRQQMEERF